MRGMGLGLGLRLGTAQSALIGGGGGLPPFAFPEDEMLLGMGLSGIASYAGYYPFANVLWNAEKWFPESASGTWSQEWGVLTTSVGADVFYAKIAEGAAIDNLPNGTYTVFNPDECEIGVGWGGTPNLTGWTTDPEFTFTKSGSSIVALYAKGSVTNINGPIQVIMPGRRDAFLAGDIWNPAFITFLSGLGVECLRFMDWLQTYKTIVEDWSDAPPSNPTLIRAPQTLLDTQVPYSAILSLANQLGIDPWITVPVRASDDYVTELATLIRDTLSPNRYVYVEFGNETWNYAGSFNDARVWVEHFFNTRYEATPNVGIDGWTHVAHGLSTGDYVAQFFDRANFSNTGNATIYPLGYGALLYVEKVDNDNFRLWAWEGTMEAPVLWDDPAAPGLNVKLLYKKHVEAGKTVDVNTNHGIRSKQVWDIFETVLGADRVVNVMGTQLVGAAGTTARLAPTGVRAAADAVGIASYYSGDWWVTCLDIASGQVTPKVWSRNADGAIRVAVYAAGSTPTMAQVLAGAGTGYIGHSDISGWVADAGSYTSGAAITGLTNGTPYECRAILTGEYGYKWMAEGQFTASASASTVPVYDSDENMAARARRNTVEFLLPFMVSQAEAADGIPLVGYETGSDYFGGNTGLAEVKAWRTAWTQTEIAGEVFGHFYASHGASGLRLMNQFVDINGNPGVFNMAESFEDTDDYRYQKFVAYDGAIPNSPPLVMADLVAPDVATEPSYPSVVYEFPDDTLTYSIYNGDENSNFDIVGNELRIVNGTGINWAVPTLHSLSLEVSNGATTVYPDIAFATGNAWYASDAKFAWNSIADTDTATIDPEVGNSLALTGTAATYDGGSGLWDFNQVGRYANLNALTSSFSGDNPALIAAIIDKDDHDWDYDGVMQIGGAAFCQFYAEDFGKIRARWFAGGSETQAQFAAASPTGKHVLWTFYDADPTTPKVHAGVDQTEFGTGTARSLGGVTFSQNVYIGGIGSNFSKMDHGSVQVVSRVGMTLSDALAMIANMQTLHGI